MRAHRGVTPLVLVALTASYANAVKAPRQPLLRHWHRCWVPRMRSRLPLRRASEGEDKTWQQTLRQKSQAENCLGWTNFHSPEEAFDWDGVSQTEGERRDVCKPARVQGSVTWNQTQCDGSTQKGRRGAETATPSMFPGRKWTSWWRVPLLAGSFSMRRVGWTPILRLSTQDGVAHGPSRCEVSV